MENVVLICQILVNSVSHDTLPVDTAGQARPLTDISSPAFPSPQSCLLVQAGRDNLPYSDQLKENVEGRDTVYSIQCREK